MRIVIDTGGLDALQAGAGQYRYVIDLVRGLAELQPPCSFMVFGTRPAPPVEVQDVFADGRRWEYRSLPRLHGRGSFYRDLVRFSMALRQQRADLCHTLHTFVPLFPPCPVVATVYDLMHELFPEYAGAVRSRPYRITRWLMRHRAQRIICISQTTADDVHRLWGVERERLDVVPLGSSLAAGRSSDAVYARLAEPADGPLLVAPYNLEPRKNLATLLDAVARLRPAYPALRLMLFGRAAVTAEREAAFLQQVARLGIANAVAYTGLLSDEELAQLYRQATVFVFPSLYEGFGLPVLEAMAAGACVVVRDASAMAEVAGAAGVRVETHDSVALAAALADLLAAPARRTALGCAARVRAARFTIRRMAEQTFGTYVQALRDVGRHADLELPALAADGARSADPVYAPAGGGQPC